MSYTAHLKQDPLLAPLLSGPAKQLTAHQNIALRLMAAIMSQQLNTKVAAIIFQRFLALYGGTEPLPQQVKDTPYEQLRGIGLSHAKVCYVHAVADFCVVNRVTDTMLHGMSNDEIIAFLTQIKGVGQWTCEMLLMFTLGREDVFPADDLGIQQAMIKCYGLVAPNKKALKSSMMAIAEHWRPYRTYASLHLWAWKDGEAAAEKKPQ
ncbi:MAG: DNA-3-methyladenine glycosylase 2 family protein [Bacteroidetes bacterium]|nr:MAG: DNA-3-methyladenine glycosylase 2 family protein [Bacteroidota bacterium]